jgi:hypothetical protein
LPGGVEENHELKYYWYMAHIWTKYLPHIGPGGLPLHHLFMDTVLCYNDRH